MKQRLLIILVLIANIGIAQNEANIWYFGENAGLDFNSGSPVAITDGLMVTQEGCASIADSSGNLQFYTDGSTIWAKDHSVMINGTGLNGHFSSTQSSIIVPKPESSNVYYVFTVDFQGESNGLQYSEVDMSLNGGLGEVTSNKNVPLLSPVLEKLTAVQHANGKDIWVLAHRNGSSEFYAYQITTAEVQTPVITDIGFSYSGASYSENAGYMKVSPNGKRLAMVFPKFNNGLQLFDFDNASGQISNHRNFNDVPGAVQPYGLEFSPSGDLLYVSGTSGIGQFDLTLTDIFQMQLNYIFLTNEITNSNWGALQLAPDGKIYVTRIADDTFPDINVLSVINNPDDLGLTCDFQLDAVPLGTGIAKSGLPPFIQSFFVVGFDYENLCFGNSTQFNANITQAYDSLTWDFGDGSTSNIENPTHTYLNTGNYVVTLSVTFGGQTSTDSKTVTIYKQPIAYKPQDLLICDDNNDGFFSFDLTQQDSDILNGQDNAIFDIEYYASIGDYNNSNPISNPRNYSNVIAHASQDIVASVRNVNHIDCEEIATFNIQVFDTPTPSQNVPSLSFCDNDIIGTDADGIIEFDLTQNETIILNGQSSLNYTVSYYSDALFANLIANPSSYHNTNRTETIYVRVVNNANSNCTGETSFNIEVFELPNVSPFVELKQCDDDLDGFSIFNLMEVYSELSSHFQNKVITFHESRNEAEAGANGILNTTTYSNQTASADSVWARVENANNCYRVAQVNLIVSTTQIPDTYTRDFYQCDDGTDISDGVASFDLSTVNAEIEAMFPAGQQLIINYYRNLADALSEINPISDINDYRNIGYPNTQDVFIRVDSALDNDCLGLGHHITLHVERVPVANPIIIPEQCDDDGDGMYSFDTSDIEVTLLNGQNDVTVIYTDENGNLLPSPLPNPFLTSTQKVRVRVINSASQDPNDPCYDETDIIFTVDAEAIANPVPDFVECDDNDDGEYAFDISGIENTILNGQTGMIVSYFDENDNKLSSPLPNPFKTSTQTITVRVENPLSSRCFDTTTIDFVVTDQPELLMNDIWLICENDTVEVIADAGYDEYSWSNGETSESITVSEVGSYEITVTNVYGSVRCSSSKTVTVVSSGVATISDIKTQDWTRSNNGVTIFVEGTGDYEYSINGINYQDSNEFKNLDVDDYMVYVRDKNGCGITSEDIYLMYYPHVFTPNGDGYNDTWQIINSGKEPLNKIYIYDRYGKLLKQLNPNDIGWDGTFNGQLLSSNDYWFVFERQNGKTYKGHFTLKK